MEKDRKRQEKQIQAAMEMQFPNLDLCSMQCFSNTLNRLSEHEAQCIKTCMDKNYEKKLVV